MVEKERYRLTAEGYRAAWEAGAKREGKDFTLGLAFRYATEGRGIVVYIIYGICIGVCYTIGAIKKTFNFSIRR